MGVIGVLSEVRSQFLAEHLEKIGMMSLLDRLICILFLICNDCFLEMNIVNKVCLPVIIKEERDTKTHVAGRK